MKSIIYAIVFLVSSTSVARVINYGKSVVSASIPYGKPTLFMFDKPVRTLSSVSAFEMKPANSENPDFTTLSVMPRMPTSDALVAVIFDDGKTLKVRIRTKDAASTDLADPLVEFKEVEVGDSQEEALQNGSRTTELELMKSMIQDDFISGFDRRELDRPIDTSQKGVSAKLIRQYEGESMHGYIFKVTNQMQFSSVTLNLRRLKLGKPNVAILSQADRLVLSSKSRGKNETLLRIVTKPTARYADVRLPIGIQKSEQNEVKK